LILDRHRSSRKVVVGDLSENGLDEVVRGTNKAATAGSTAVHARLGTLLGRAVLKSIAKFASVARVASEDALLHVGDTGLAGDGHAATLHVGKTGDIDGREFTVVGEFTPSVADLSVNHGGILVDGRPSARGASLDRDVESASVDELVGDQRNNGVDPRSSRSPEDDDNVLARFVGELGNVITVIANPGSVASISRVGVETSQTAKSLEDVTNEAALLLGDSCSTAKGQVGEENSRKVEAHLDGCCLVVCVDKRLCGSGKKWLFFV
jgi:hypothetical protein